MFTDQGFALAIFPPHIVYDSDFGYPCIFQQRVYYIVRKYDVYNSYVQPQSSVCTRLKILTVKMQTNNKEGRQRCEHGFDDL